MIPVAPAAITPLSEMPYWIVKYAFENRGDVEKVWMTLCEELGEQKPTRDHARKLIQQAVEELEHDVVSSAPSGGDHLVRRIDTELRDEIERRLKENDVYRGVLKDCKGDMDKGYKVFDTYEVISAGEAKERLDANLKVLLEFKRSLVDHKKADNGSGTNINLNFGSILGEAINNIKTVEAL